MRHDVLYNLITSQMVLRTGAVSGVSVRRHCQYVLNGAGWCTEHRADRESRDFVESLVFSSGYAPLRLPPHRHLSRTKTVHPLSRYAPLLIILICAPAGIAVGDVIGASEYSCSTPEPHASRRTRLTRLTRRSYNLLALQLNVIYEHPGL